MPSILSLSPQLQERLAITPDQLTEFCQRRHINQMALFGSVLRDDFHESSNIDMLVTFHLHLSLLWQMRPRAETTAPTSTAPPEKPGCWPSLGIWAGPPQEPNFEL